MGSSPHATKLVAASERSYCFLNPSFTISFRVGRWRRPRHAEMSRKPHPIRGPSAFFVIFGPLLLNECSREQPAQDFRINQRDEMRRAGDIFVTRFRLLVDQKAR